MPMRSRRAFTLAEMLISMVIVTIIGGALTRVLTSQTRFYERESALRTARSIARGATNVLLADLRMVQDSGSVDSVTANGRTIRILVPYRFGLVCATNGSRTTVSMLPTDSSTVALSVYQGFGWRDSTSGRYTYVTRNNPNTPAGLPTASGSSADCTGNGTGQAQIRTVTTNGRSGEILDIQTNGASGARMGSPVFFYQRVTYSFRASDVWPNRLALWRNVQGGVNEEIMAPFDTSTRFRFYQAGDDDSRLTPPPVSDIRGLELVLTGLNPRATATDTITRARISTSVFFKNVRGF